MSAINWINSHGVLVLGFAIGYIGRDIYKMVRK